MSATLFIESLNIAQRLSVAQKTRSCTGPSWAISQRFTSFRPLGFLHEQTAHSQNFGTKGHHFLASPERAVPCKTWRHSDLDSPHRHKCQETLNDIGRKNVTALFMCAVSAPVIAKGISYEVLDLRGRSCPRLQTAPVSQRLPATPKK